MLPETFLASLVDPALLLLPEKMNSDEARRMIVAICLQESGLKYRRQVGGPAMGFPMFETNGVRAVSTHPVSEPFASTVVRELGYGAIANDYAKLQAVFEHNDILAIVFTRLLLFTLPSKLPTVAELGWQQYVDAWRPGRPRKETWSANWSAADIIVKANP